MPLDRDSQPLSGVELGAQRCRANDHGAAARGPLEHVHGSNRKRLEKPALPHGCYLARALMHPRSFTVLLDEVTSKIRLRFWNLSTAAPDHDREVATPRGCSAPQGGDENRLFFAEMTGAVAPPASAASLANRSAFSRAVFSITARLAASYSAMAFAPSRA